MVKELWDGLTFGMDSEEGEESTWEGSEEGDKGGGDQPGGGRGGSEEGEKGG